MRADAAVREKEKMETTTTQLYQWSHDQRTAGARPPFVLHDGPPFANGRLHMGHALNKILKDVINRHALLSGSAVHYVPGWDTHGLPIELKALDAARKDSAKAIKKIKKELKRAIKAEAGDEVARLEAQLAAAQSAAAGREPTKIRKLAAEFAASAATEQKDALLRWGVMGDYDNAYYTMAPAYEAAQLELWSSLYHRGLFSRRLKPVYWSPSTQTALAEAELEYKPHTSTAVHVAFRARASDQLLAALGVDLAPRPIDAVAWTTTPWTLVANQGLAFGPALDYALVESGAAADAPLVLVASARIGALVDAGVLPSSPRVVADGLSAEAIAGTVFSNPVVAERDSVALMGDHVTDDAGTGVVHTAPGHGAEDYTAMARAGLLNTDDPLFCPVDGAGKYTDALASVGLGQLVGQPVLDAGTKSVVELLHAAENAPLLAAAPLEHSYPYDWRTAKPIIFRATMQWFMDLSAVKGAALNALDDVTMVPPEGAARLAGMIGTRDEWCISRQRVWGVPIPVFYHRETGEVLATRESLSHVVELVARHGTNAWFDRPVSELLPASLADEAHKYVKSVDTMDVWFDSGSSWYAVLAKSLGSPVQADVYLEGSDQHRGWFQSSLITSSALQDPPRAPYKTLITNGFVLDGAGNKMAKSLGNVVDPDQVVHGGANAKKEPPYGADVLRLWVAAQEYTRDVRLGPQGLSSAADTYRKLRNTAKFVLGNIADAPAELLMAAGAPAAASPLDRLVLSSLHELNTKVQAAYSSYAFHAGLFALLNYVNTFLSAFYLDSAKDTLYAEAADDSARRAVQYVLYRALDVVTRAAAPIAPFLAEEVWGHMPLDTRRDDHFSLFQSGYAETGPLRDPASDALRDALLDLRGEANKALEGLRQAKAIGGSLEAQVVVAADVLPESLAAWLATLSPGDLANVFGVSSAQLESSAATGGATVLAAPASGSKCDRCWKVTPDVSGGGLCGRCAAVVGGEAAM
ncbi:isoleucyl-tRNA synthetase [Thecamonas trahens ATCC 50062]|uniref:isoleucine--tRNA ligase n=1 Tax=Thecamonas trahens ATCC 50062 TaxID=461836 RepID=A0A0L0DRM9_THETB|nr:isoleucyl-tRNA synthetase [Thecamonas trahens ATCC 50062]KNC54989.1 isoleucyl-tRNA synthetase [Thecamonas trahens ATCC 50062]|eukprot:XP_013753434.1 isoleucyl-tRNA synthetase [Thecamonas trahens ATCC 50062]